MSFFSKATERKRFDVNVQRVSSIDATTLLRAPKQKTSHKILHKTYALVMALTIVCLSVLAGMGGSRPAQANPFDFQNDICTAGAWSYDLEKRTFPPDTRNAKGLGNRDGIGSGAGGTSKTATAYERYGMAGTTWTVWSGPQEIDHLKGEGKYQGKSIVSFMGGDLDKNQITKTKVTTTDYPAFYNTNKACFPAGSIIVTGLANGVMSATKIVVHISNFVFQVAYDGSSSVVEKMTPSITKIIEGLYKKLYVEPVLIIGMLAAIAVLIQGIFKKQFTQAFQSAVWFAFALLLGFFMKLNPMIIHNVSDYVVKTGTEIVITALMSGTTNNSGDKDQLGKLCEIKKDSGETTTISTVRNLQCTMWYSFVYTPWVMGQFGSEPGTGNAIKPNAGDMGIDSAKTGGMNVGGSKPGQKVDNSTIRFNGRTFTGDWTIYWLDNKVIKTDTQENFNAEARQTQQTNLVSTTVAQLHKPAAANFDFQGANSGSRLTYAVMSLIASLASGFMVVLLSFSLIIMELGTMILIILSPVFLLVAAHPTVGKRIFLGYLETLVNLAISRIAIAMILGLMVTLYSAVINVSSSLGWLLSLVMVVAISMAGIQYRQQIIDMFAKVSFGSGGAGITPQKLPGMDKAKSVVGGYVGGAAVVGAAKGIRNKVSANKQQKRADNQRAAQELRNRKENPDGTGSSSAPTKVGPVKKNPMSTTTGNSTSGTTTKGNKTAPTTGGKKTTIIPAVIPVGGKTTSETNNNNTQNVDQGNPMPNKVAPTRNVKDSDIDSEDYGNVLANEKIEVQRNHDQEIEDENYENHDNSEDYENDSTTSNNNTNTSGNVNNASGYNNTRSVDRNSNDNNEQGYDNNNPRPIEKVEPAFVRREKEKLANMERPRRVSSSMTDPNSPEHLKMRTKLESARGVGNVSYEDVVKELKNNQPTKKQYAKNEKTYAKQQQRVKAANNRMQKAVEGKERIVSRRNSFKETYSTIKETKNDFKKRATETATKPVKKVTRAANNSKFVLAAKDRHEAARMKEGAYNKAIENSKRVNETIVQKKNSIKTTKQENKVWKKDSKELVKGYKRERRLTKQGKPLPPRVKPQTSEASIKPIQPT